MSQSAADAHRTELSRRPVVVGIDGTDQSLRAVRYAALEALRLGSRLRLVHAQPETTPLAPMLPLVGSETLDEVSTRIVAEARRVAVEVAGDQISLDAVVRSGPRVHVLVAVAADAELMVMGHRDRSLLGRVLTSSTTTGVAAHAACPVVCVPSTWSPDTSQRPVVVGVEDPDQAREELSVAFAAADARRTSLRVLHTWKLPGRYDDAVVSQSTLELWRAAATSVLNRVLADWQLAYPAVRVEVDVRHQHPAPALVGASEGADLLVLGRHGRSTPFGMHLGSVARTLIREARCPVEVAPVPRQAGSDLPDPDDVEPSAVH